MCRDVYQNANICLDTVEVWGSSPHGPTIHRLWTFFQKQKFVQLRVPCSREAEVAGHAPLLLDTTLDLSPSKPLGFCAARALVRSWYDRFLLFRAPASARSFPKRHLLSRAARVALDTLFFLGPVRFVRDRHFHFHSSSAAALQSAGRMPHACQRNERSRDCRRPQPAGRAPRRAPPAKRSRLRADRQRSRRSTTWFAPASLSSWMTPSRKARSSTPASTAPISSSSPPTISRPLSSSPSAPASATRKPPSWSAAISTNSPKSLRASAPTKSSPVPRAPSTKLQRTSARLAPPVDFPRRQLSLSLFHTTARRTAFHSPKGINSFRVTGFPFFR